MDRSLTTSFTVGRSPEEVFAAVTDVRAWWSGRIEGDTATPGAEFTYTVPDVHFSRFRITEQVPYRRVAWLVLDSALSFVADPQEWTGTTVAFDITPTDGGTRLVFTHEGLAPDHECYDVCSNAWGQYVGGSLRALIEGGAGRPNSFEGEQALAATRGTG